MCACKLHYTSTRELLAQLGDMNLHASTKGTNFCMHLFTAYWQQSQYLESINSLKFGKTVWYDILIVMRGKYLHNYQK